MAATEKKRWYRSGSTWVAGLLVAGAAAATWFGTAGGGGAHGPGGAPVTMAATQQPTGDHSAVQGLALGGLPTRLVAAKAGIDAPIAEVGIVDSGSRSVWETAWHSVGHHLDSSLPGQPGNMVLTGHVSVADHNNAAYFAKLDELAPGDLVDVYSGAEVFHYKVTKVSVVSPTAVNVLRSGAGSTITLITCTHDLKNRLVVVGTLA